MVLVSGSCYVPMVGASSVSMLRTPVIAVSARSATRFAAVTLRPKRLPRLASRGTTARLSRRFLSSFPLDTRKVC
jgi:hypothetical protein